MVEGAVRMKDHEAGQADYRCEKAPARQVIASEDE